MEAETSLMNLAEFQSKIGVDFVDPALLRRALTHRSYLNETDDDTLQDNERLEFLGDAILDFVTADMLYQRYPEMSEGKLTRLRAALVRTEALAELGGAIDIGAVLLIGKGEEASGGRTRINNLCRTFEALIGAIYEDQGLEAVKQFVLPRLSELLERVLVEALHKDARSRLQEWSQAMHNTTPSYRTVAESGPDHSKEFWVEVTVGGEIIGRGSGRSKQAAAQSAARQALENVQSNPPPAHEVQPQPGESAQTQP